jgi:urease accessory protein
MVKLRNQVPDYQITRLPDSRLAREIGRAARLELIFERRGARTQLVHAYAEPPFRVGRTFAFDDAAFVIVVCAGPGVFGGDIVDMSVRIGRGARVVLTSQAALQAHPSSSPAPARIAQRYDVDEEAELHCHWDPLIPFAGARIEQRFEICAARGARLYWSDALMAGRAMRGEAWQFAELSHDLRYDRNGACAYRERYTLIPSSRPITRSWAAGSTTHLATLLVDHPEATASTAECLHRTVCAIPGVRTAADLIEPGLIVGRVAAASGAPFAAARTALRDVALGSIFGQPHLALRGKQPQGA